MHHECRHFWIRFVRYAKIDTQASELGTGYPSTPKQLELCRLLAGECAEIGLRDVSLSEHGVVTATIPSMVEHAAPVIAWFAHVDTSPEFTAENVRPVIHRNYDGSDIVLPADPNRVIRVAENPALLKLIGGTIITTDGTTLLGADDKSGIAVIMMAAAQLLAHCEIPHGPIRVCFTCDEEIGHGVDHVDIPKLDVVCGYTLDSEGCGRIDNETFSADSRNRDGDGREYAPLHRQGGNGEFSAHPKRIHWTAADRNAVPRNDRRPPRLPASVPDDGTVASSTARIILRDFETPRLREHANLLETIAADLRARHPRSRIEIEIVKQYRNMREGLKKEPRALAKAVEAVRATGLEPNLAVIRGGTDGSVLTERGLPTPNLSSGQHNPHSPLEWTSLEEMQKAVDILIQLAVVWGREKR